MITFSVFIRLIVNIAFPWGKVARAKPVTDEGMADDIGVSPKKQVKAFAPQGRRWHGEAMTDEGDHGGASVVGRADTEVGPY